MPSLVGLIVMFVGVVMIYYGLHSDLPWTQVSKLPPAKVGP